MKGLLIRVGVIIAFLAYSLYSYTDRQNRLTTLKIEIFELAKDINRLKEENERLLYEAKKMENPSSLLKLVKAKEFAHLKHPIVDNILKVKEGIAINASKSKDNNYSSKHTFSLAVGR